MVRGHLLVDRGLCVAHPQTVEGLFDFRLATRIHRPGVGVIEAARRRNRNVARRGRHRTHEQICSDSHTVAFENRVEFATEMRDEHSRRGRGIEAERGGCRTIKR